MTDLSAITVTPIFVADLHVEGERMPIYVHLVDHPHGRVLVDTGMTELHPLLDDMEPRLRPLHEQDLDLCVPGRRNDLLQAKGGAARSSQAMVEGQGILPRLLEMWSDQGPGPVVQFPVVEAVGTSLNSLFQQTRVGAGLAVKWHQVTD